MGLAITREAVLRGHLVYVFNRGKTPVSEDILQGVEHIVGDRNSDLSGLSDSSVSWDITIDVNAYRPHQVDLLCDALGGRGGKYIYISTVSVYAEDVEMHSGEAGKKVVPSALEGIDCKSCPIDGKTYGALKLLCEQRAEARFEKNNLLIIRPTYVIGPNDHTKRFNIWVQRIAAGGVINCPKPFDNPFQYIDARDQAKFVIDLAERGTSGVFNSCVSPEITFGELLETILRTVGPPDTRLNWVDVPTDGDEKEAQIYQLYPLWSGPTVSPMMTMDSASAVENGLTFRPISETITDTMRWLVSKDTPQ